MSFTEYKPRCGWLKYNRRKRLFKAVFFYAGCLFVVCGYLALESLLNSL